MSARLSNLTRLQPAPDLPEVWRPSQLRKRIGTEKVAALCYRFSNRGFEVLLVRTRGGRWTFPKGGVEPGLTRAQSAALEAFEEAGVHGRMEKSSFARYVHRDKGGAKRSRRETVVHVHLCEVLRLGTPKESGREPTWFATERARSRLRQGRTREYGEELARVVELAVTRIPQSASEVKGDEALRRVSIEALPRRTAKALIFAVRSRGWSKEDAHSDQAAIPIRQRLLEGESIPEGNQPMLTLAPQLRYKRRDS